jgi:hypothetical protein
MGKSNKAVFCKIIEKTMAVGDCPKDKQLRPDFRKLYKAMNSFNAKHIA